MWVEHSCPTPVVHMFWDLLEIIAGLMEVFGELMIEVVAKLMSGPKT